MPTDAREAFAERRKKKKGHSTRWNGLSPQQQVQMRYRKMTTSPLYVFTTPSMNRTSMT